VGTDLCHIPRVRALLEKNIGKKAKDNARPLSQFLSRLLTWPERQYFWGRFKDSESAYANIDKVAQFLAGR
jgi:holo-[acyl-carrier protein] synthase